jgi:hypothetical protein
MAAPSRHPRSTRPRYFWINPAREIVRDEIPVPFQLAELPEEWVDGLRSRIPRGPRPAGTVEGGARAWALSRPGGNCEPCVVLRATLNRYTAELEAGGGAHPVMVTGTHALIGDSALGHVGLYWALKRFAKLYLSVVKGRRSADTATAEFHRAVDSEVAARVAAGIDDVDPCSWDFSGWAR